MEGKKLQNLSAQGLHPLEVTYLIKEDIQQHDFAFGNDQSGYFGSTVFPVLRPVA